jgi:hypothetical protein
MKKLEPITRDENGDLVIDLDADELNASWISSLRLQRRAEQGDQEAAAELKRRDGSPLYVEDD